MKRFTLSVILLTFSVMACGMQVSSASVIMDSHTNTSTQTVTQTSTKEMTVCHTETGLHVRPAAGDLSTYSRTLKPGDSTILRIPATVIEDMGLWYQLADGSGWVNAKYLCEAE